MDYLEKLRNKEVEVDIRNETLENIITLGLYLYDNQFCPETVTTREECEKWFIECFIEKWFTIGTRNNTHVDAFRIVNCDTVISIEEFCGDAIVKIDDNELMDVFQ